MQLPRALDRSPGVGGRRFSRRRKPTRVYLTDRALLARAARELKGWWRRIGLVALLEFFSTPLSLLTPVPLAIAVDSALGGKPLPAGLDAVLPGWITGSPTRVLVLASVMTVVVAVLSQGRSFLAAYAQTVVSERATLSLRSRLLAHTQRLSFRFHDQRGTADSVYRIQYDASSVPSIATTVLIPFMVALVTLVSMIYIIARLDGQLALVALAIAPLLFLLGRDYRARTKPLHRQVKKLESNALKVVQEVFAAFRVVKAFGLEERERERFQEQAQATVDARVRVTVVDGVFSLFMGTVTASGTALVLFLGITRVRAGELSLGALLMVLSYLTQLYSPLQTVSKQVGRLQSQLASTERVAELLDEVPEVRDEPGALPLERAEGRFRLEGVSFAYEPGQDVLGNVGLDLPAGSRIGIVGRTGAGKSTLLSLLIRFYDVTKGRILLDGVDLRRYRLTDLRRQFAMVLQDPFLFSTSILDNIRYARPEASCADVIAAAQAAGIHDLVTSLPDGYQTVVGERGMRLSGGERQRISLARAFLKDAPILLLDEPTSSVDTETEASIMGAMRRLMEGRTTFMIAHRLSTLEGCDIIVRVADGRVERLDQGEATTADLPRGAGAKHEAAEATEAGEPDAGLEATRAAAALVSGFRATKVRAYPSVHPVSTVYHVFEEWSGRSLALKRQSRSSAAIEDHVYRRILPALQVPRVRSYGTWPSPSRVAEAWLATDHVRGPQLDPAKPEHSTAMARWLGMVHVRASMLPATRALPRHDAAYWQRLLDEARRVLDGGLANPELSPEELSEIVGVRSMLLDTLERWPAMVALLDKTPPTLVHGDLTLQNVRLSLQPDGLWPMVFDWESAGYGSPMIDLLLADLPAYQETVSSDWPGLDLGTLQRLRALGAVVWTAFVLLGERENLESAWPHRAAAKLPAYRQSIESYGLPVLLEREAA